jgi:hypothetical protein
MLMFVLNALESCTHSLIQSANPSLMLVEYSKKKCSRSILISVDFCGCSYSEVYKSENDDIMTQFPKPA